MRDPSSTPLERVIGLASGAGRKAMARSLELRRPLGFALVLALVVFLAWRKASPIDQTADRSDWNALILTLDTTRADRLGAYGFAGADTPNIDRLACEGALFEQAEWSTPMGPPAKRCRAGGS